MKILPLIGDLSCLLAKGNMGARAAGINSALRGEYALYWTKRGHQTRRILHRVHGGGLRTFSAGEFIPRCPSESLFLAKEQDKCIRGGSQDGFLLFALSHEASPSLSQHLILNTQHFSPTDQADFSSRGEWLGESWCKTPVSIKWTRSAMLTT